jgi:putative transposase
MTAPHIVDPARLLSEALAEASPDLVRSLLQTTINALLSADADAVVGAGACASYLRKKCRASGGTHFGLIN